jgi:hypothetical protein
MAGGNIKVGAEITGDASSLKKAASEAQKAVNNLQREINASNKKFKESSESLDQIGNALGGVAGEMASSIANFIQSATPLGAIVLLVGTLAKVWKESKENIDLYLKSADKLAIGTAGFESDVNKAREDTQKRAKGQIAEGRRQEEYAKRQLLLQKDLTIEQKTFLESLKSSAVTMQQNGKLLYNQVSAMDLTGKFTKNKLEWEYKYNALLKEQEQINDDGLANQVKWASLEAEITEARRIIGDKDATAAEKKQAGLNAEKAANQLLKEKIPYLDRQIANVTAISEMTLTQEVVEDKLAALEKERYDIQKEFSADMIKVQKAQDRTEKSTERQVASLEKLKKSYGEIAKLYSHVTSFAGAVSPKTKGGGLATWGWGRAGAVEGEQKSIEDANSTIVEGIQIVNDLQNAFENLFANTGEGFKGMAIAFGNALKQMIAQLLAKAAIFGILTIISGGTGKFASWASNALGGKTLGKFMGFASGTNFAPGGLSLVGERGPELVNLPRGSQVIPMRNQKMTIEVVGKLKAKDIQFALSRYNAELYSNT